LKKQIFLIVSLILPGIMHWILLRYTHDAIITLAITVPLCYYGMTWLFEKMIADFSWEMALLKEVMGWEKKRDDGILLI